MYACLQTINMENNLVSSLVKMNSKMFISGNANGEMRIWVSGKDGFFNCNQTITKYQGKGHMDMITQLVRLNDAIFLSGSDDYNIKVWKRNSTGGFIFLNSINLAVPIYSLIVNSLYYYYIIY